MNCESLRGRKFQPKRMCSSSERAWYWVRTWMRRRPEWMQFESVKSMMRYAPPKGTEGFARLAVSGIRRSPWPPARMKVRVSRSSVGSDTWSPPLARTDRALRGLSDDPTPVDRTSPPECRLAHRLDTPRRPCGAPRAVSTLVFHGAVPREPGRHGHLMRVLMLGWDFSPRLSGGVGSACQGLTNALTRAKEPQATEVLLVLPRVRGDEEPENVR